MLWVKNTGNDFSTPSHASYKVNGALIGKRDILPSVPTRVLCARALSLDGDLPGIGRHHRGLRQSVAESNETDNTWTKANFCTDWSKK